MKKKNLYSDLISIGVSMAIVILVPILGFTFCSNDEDIIIDQVPTTEEYYQDLGYTTENFDGFLIVRKGQGE